MVRACSPCGVDVSFLSSQYAAHDATVCCPRPRVFETTLNKEWQIEMLLVLPTAAVEVAIVLTYPCHAFRVAADTKLVAILQSYRLEKLPPGSHRLLCRVSFCVDCVFVFWAGNPQLVDFERRRTAKFQETYDWKPPACGIKGIAWASDVDIFLT